MKVLSKLLLVGMAGAMFAACSKDPEFEDPMGPVGSGETVSTTLELSVSGMKSPVTAIGTSQTRAAVDEAVSVAFSEDSDVVTRAETTTPTAAESALKSLYVLQFDENDKFLKKLDVDLSTLSSGTTLSVNVPLDGHDKSTVYAIANVDATKFSNKDESFTVSDFEALLYQITAAVDINNGLPMIGSWSGSTKDTSKGTPKIEMKRMVAKISFICKQDVPVGHSFSLTSVQLCSVSPQSAYKAPASGTTAPDATKVTFIDYAKVSSATLGETYEWYVPENLRGTVAGITSPSDKGENNAPTGSTFIEVVGSYNDGSNPAANVTFRIFPGANSTTDFNVARNHKYAITATVKGNNPDDGRVVVATDLCKNPFDDSKEEFANCYMVSKAGHTYKFDAVHLFNGATTGDPKSVKVLWETNGAQAIIKSVELKNGWVYFTTAGDSGDTITEGNAVIAVYDTTTPGNQTNVLWSWHIWSTQCDPADANSYYTGNSYKFLKYNLGADCTSNEGTVGRFGLYYQWGRKDPFIGVNPSAGISFGNQTSFATNTASTYGSYSWATAAVSSSTGTIDYAKKHPMTFITATASPYDWLSTKNDDLWGTGWSATGSTGGYNGNKGKKSVYDPCPPGYRVPPQDAWSNLSTTSGVFDWNATTHGRKGSGTAQNFYPAAGHRACNNGGGLYYVGSNGNYWSSSPNSSSSTSAGRLSFHSTAVNPQNNSSRANGFSVRCVQNF